MPRGISYSYGNKVGNANQPAQLDVDLSGTQGPIIAGFSAQPAAVAWGAVTPTTFTITDLDTGLPIASYAVDAQTDAIVVVFGDVEGTPFAVAIKPAGFTVLSSPTTSPQSRPRRVRLDVGALGAGVGALLGLTTTPLYQSPSESQ